MNATVITQPSSLGLLGWCGGKGNSGERVNMCPDHKKTKNMEEEVLVQFVFVSSYTALF